LVGRPCKEGEGEQVLAVFHCRETGAVKAAHTARKAVQQQQVCHLLRWVSILSPAATTAAVAVAATAGGTAGSTTRMLERSSQRRLSEPFSTSRSQGGQRCIECGASNACVQRCSAACGLCCLASVCAGCHQRRLVQHQLLPSVLQLLGKPAASKPHIACWRRLLAAATICHALSFALALNTSTCTCCPKPCAKATCVARLRSVGSAAATSGSTALAAAAAALLSCRHSTEGGFKV
jgi:hypothetical protein